MRKLSFALLSFGVASFPLLSAAQHVSVAPAIAPPAMHAAPVHAASAVAAAHASNVRPGPHPSSSQVRPGIHAASASRTASKASTSSSTPPRNNSWHSASSHTLPTYPPLVPDSPVLLPGNIFSGTSCFSPYNCVPVPGYGFSYEHFYAVHRNWGSSILTAGIVVPFSDSGGFYTPIPYYYSAPYPPEEQPAPEMNYPPGPNENVRNQQVVSEQPPAPTPTSGYYPPSEPVYEYVFVKRDGTKIFAVAYAFAKDKLQYVTKEGLRRSIPLDALDLPATQKSNEERGNTINFPAPPPSAMAQAL